MDDTGWTPPTPPPEGWSLDALVEGTADAMTALGLDGIPPDRRTVRYYATLGLLDRAEPAGREVRYRRRHLLQLLAVKRLQAAGVRLRDIGAHLSGLDDERLRETLTEPVVPRAEPRDAPAGETVRFWERRPSEPVSRPGPLPAPGPARDRTVVTLAPEIELSLPRTRLTATEHARLTAAARPLLELITALGIQPDPTSTDRTQEHR